MKEKLLWLVLISCLASTSLCFGEDTIELFADPEAIFIKQSSLVTLTLKTPKSMHDIQVMLVKMQDDGKEKIIGRMHDDGKEGDDKAKDGVFSYIIKTTPEKAEVLHFKGVIKKPNSTAKIESKEKTVEVIECPE